MSERRATRRTSSVAAIAEARKQDKKPKLATIPLGVASELPSASFEGELVPLIGLTFDPASAAVVEALANPKSLRVKWPITGKVNHLHDLTLPCVLRWRVSPAEGASRGWKNNPDAYLSDAEGKKTELVIDGGGRFKVLVDDADPVLDLIVARLIKTGHVGFSVALQRPAGTQPQESEQELFYALPCEVEVGLQVSRDAPPEPQRIVAPPPAAPGDMSAPMSPAPADHTSVLLARIPEAVPEAPAVAPKTSRIPSLGDRMTFSATMHELLKNTELELRVVEKESGLWAGQHDVQAWSRVYPKGGLRPCTWVIGFADKTGSSMVEPRFSYVDEVEEGGTFEYGWELHAKSSNAAAKNRVPILAGKEAILVAKPRLESFQVSVLDAAKGAYEVSGGIYGFSPDAPPVYLAVLLIDRLGARFPEERALLGRDGSFRQRLAGPKADALPGTQAEAPKVFAILSLVATWRSAGGTDPEGSIGGFLGFYDEKLAYFHLANGTTTDSRTLWVCSEEWVGITPRKGKKERAQLAITAPGPDAGGYQYSELTFADVWTDILAWEGFVKHMYLDSEGLVTVGAGDCLATKEDPDNPARAVALTKEFTNRKTGKKLSDASDIDKALVRKTFATIRKMPKGQNWTNYETSPLLELDDAKVEALAKAYFNERALPGMHATFGKAHFDSFPKCARRAIIDIAYNAGPNFFGAKSPLMRQAIVDTNWLAAANEVPKQGRPARKAWRQELLRYAHFIKTGERG